MFSESTLLAQLAAFVISTAMTSLFVLLAGRWTKLGPFRYTHIIMLVAAMNLIIQPLFYFVPQLGKLIPGLIIMTALYTFGFGRFLINDNGIARYKKGAELCLATGIIVVVAAVAAFLVTLIAKLVF